MLKFGHFFTRRRHQKCQNHKKNWHFFPKFYANKLNFLEKYSIFEKHIVYLQILEALHVNMTAYLSV